MELTIALAHFCDNHGPTSILCTQALPPSCFSCSPSSHTTFSSFEDDHGLHSISPTKASSPVVPAASSTPVLSFSDVIESPTAKSPPLTVFPAHNASSTKPTDPGPTPRVAPRTTRTPTSGSSSAPECINCSMTLPPNLTDPRHPPHSTTSSTSNNGKPPTSPTLRTKLPIRIYDDPESGYCSSSSTPSRPSSPSTTFPSSSTSTSKPLYTGRSSPRHSLQHHHNHHHYSSNDSPHHLTPPTAPNSYTSAHTSSTLDTTASSVLAPGQPWHDHQITYLSTHHPLSPSTYASLRRSIVRTLSGEVLPRGCTAGPLYFTTACPSTSSEDGEEDGPAATSSTIAYTFRLPDKYARGGYRVYSLIALASAEVADVYSVVGDVWRRFEGLSRWIAGMVEGEIRRRDLAEAGLLEENEEEQEGVVVGRKRQERMRKKEGGEGERGSDETVKTKSIGGGTAGIGKTASGGPPGSFLTGGGAKGERRSGSSYFGPGIGSQGGGGIGIGGGRGVGAGLRGRGLVEMCGDKEVFARLHWSFVEMLKEFS